MFEEWIYAIAIIIGAIVYAIGCESVKLVFNSVREHGILKRKKDEINLSGKWYAVWQTTVEGNENTNSEILNIKLSGARKGVFVVKLSIKQHRDLIID